MDGAQQLCITKLNPVQVLFTDTVGFIQKLPTKLVSAFRATLEELEEVRPNPNTNTNTNTNASPNASPVRVPVPNPYPSPNPNPGPAHPARGRRCLATRAAARTPHRAPTNPGLASLQASRRGSRQVSVCPLTRVRLAPVCRSAACRVSSTSSSSRRRLRYSCLIRSTPSTHHTYYGHTIPWPYLLYFLL